MFFICKSMFLTSMDLSTPLCVFAGPVEVCDDHSCDNGGQCIQEWSYYTCNCDSTSFVGPTCSDGKLSLAALHTQVGLYYSHHRCKNVLLRFFLFLNWLGGPLILPFASLPLFSLEVAPSLKPS